VPSYARSWWYATITSKAAETYVIDYHGRVVGFALLIKDEGLWREEQERREGSAISRLISCIVCPVLTFIALRRRVTSFMARDNVSTRTSIGRPYNRTWLELLAVLPQEQGHGIATKLLYECEVRSKALDRSAIGLMVPESNERAIRLYKKMGYEQTRKGPEFVFYVKALSPVVTEGEVPVLQE
jgi:GNAT superfamily N-acetyltransferase